MPFTAGDRVRVRGERWLVEEATAFPDCSVLSLIANDSSGDTHRTCRLLVPFDRPVRCFDVSTARVVSRRRWIKHLHQGLADTRIFGQLHSAAAASIEIHPFQLEPALALVLGRASRFLLADEVGLGKTIQAGLILGELRLRGWVERALIVTPSGLRRQWADELLRRFDIPATIVDATALALLKRQLPHHVNPWCAEPICITSIDFIKQPEVLHSARQQVWDIVIVDEAHQASPATQRYDAVNAIGLRSRYVVLLTATPHDGDDAAFSALCDIGKLGTADRILLFRRTRQQAGLPRKRRVHLLPVRLTPSEIEMHRLLEDYVSQLWHVARRTGRAEVQLTAVVLSKRAFSSASSLAATVERRLAALEESAPTPAQCALPFDTDVDEQDVPPELSAPAFEHADEERTLLLQLLDAAKRAADCEGKLSTIARLLRRIAEPVIVFTEYRDTLASIHSVLGATRSTRLLHGGQTLEERLEAVRAFNSAEADLLLATDAGAEGLNLQKRCRVIVNLELPWNPIRLEQRVGRVDRIGQARTVHAFNLFAENTRESTVLAALARRLDRIRSSEIEIAAAVIGRDPMPTERKPRESSVTETLDLSTGAAHEAARLQARRAHRDAGRRADDRVVPVVCIGSNVLRHSSVWFLRLRITNSAGRLLEDALIAIGLETHAERGRRVIPTLRREVRAVAQRMLDILGPSVTKFATKLGKERAAQIACESGAGLARAIRRERLIAAAVATDIPSLVQVGLFDDRARKLREMQEHQRDNISSDSAGRSASLEADRTALLVEPPEIALLLLTGRSG